MEIASVIFAIISFLVDIGIGILFSTYEVSIYNRVPFEWRYLGFLVCFSIVGIVLGALASKKNLPRKKMAKTGLILSIIGLILLLLIVCCYVGYWLFTLIIPFYNF